MTFVVLAKNKITESSVVVDDRQRVELVVPDDIVGLLQGGAFLCPDQLIIGRHELAHGSGQFHPADAVVPAGHNADQLSVRCTVFRHSHGRMAGFLLQGKDIAKRRIRAEVGIAADEPGFVALGTPHHGRLILYRLRAIDKRNAALGRQRNGKAVTGNGLHDGRNHRDVHGDSRFLSPAEADQRGFQRYILRNAFGGGITGNKQILIKRMCGFVDNSRHKISPFLQMPF